MRAVLLTILTFGALLGVFVAYTRLEAPPARAPAPDAVASDASIIVPATTQPTVAKPWVNLYDKDGQFYGRLRAQTCVPTPDGLYHLTQPEAEFYQSGGATGRDGTIVRLTAVDGDVALGDPNRHTNIGSGPIDPPSKGILHDVTIALYPDKSARDAGQPDLLGRLPNAQFNADTYQVFTIDEADRSTGQAVPADQVPISLRGRDMDLDGRGLMMYWDGEKHELKSLLIKHGERLVMKKTSTVAAGQNATPPAEASSSAPQPAPSATSIANTNPQPTAAAKAAGPSAPPATRADPIYLATFTDNVRVVQGDQTPVTADTMEVALNPRGENTSGQPASGKAASAPAAQSARLAQDAPAQDAVPAITTPIAPPAAAESPSVSASPLLPTGSSSQPVSVFWTGTLTVVPDLNPNDRVAPGQQIIRFNGNTHIHQDDLDMVGQRARYDSTNGAARMIGEGNQPLKMTLFKAGTNIVAGALQGQRVDFYPDSTRRHARAVFTGAGTAQFAAAVNTAELVRAAWQQECDVNLIAQPGSSLCIQQTILHGNATVADTIPGQPDKLHLTAQTVTADFDPPPAHASSKGTASSAGPLRKVVAAGNALCIVHDGKEPDRSLSTDLLTIETATDSQGKPYPKFIIADGNVRGAQADQRFSSRHLDVTLAPPAASSTSGGGKTSQLQTLLATGDVDLIGANGDHAQGDTLTLDQRNGPGEQFLTLLGTPKALITGNNGRLQAAHIEAKPKQHWARIIGPGMIDAVSAPQPGQRARPMHVQWKDSAQITPIPGHDDENLIQVHGNVSAETHGQSEGNGPATLTRNEATSDNAELVLVPAPPQAAKTKAPAKADESLDLFKDKQIQTATLIDHAAVTSTQTSADGVILQRAFITGNRIETNLPRQTMYVPGTGQMLLEDHQKSTVASVSANSSASPTSGRGATGFWWSKSFAFDQHARQAVIDGSVIIKHINDAKPTTAASAPEANKTDATTILADHVVADFEPVAGQPAMTAGQLQDAPLTLKQLTATGNVEIRAGAGALPRGATSNPAASGATIVCSTAIYDKTKEELTAMGTPDDPVRVYSNQGARQAAFGQVVIDARTNMVKSVSDFTGMSR